MDIPPQDTCSSFPTAICVLPPAIQSKQDLTCLQEYNKNSWATSILMPTLATLGESFFISLSNPAVSNDLKVYGGPIHEVHQHDISWCLSLPSPHALCSSGFRKLDLLHSFLIKPGLETCLYHILCSGYEDVTTLTAFVLHTC